MFHTWGIGGGTPPLWKSHKRLCGPNRMGYPGGLIGLNDMLYAKQAENIN